MNGPTDPTIDDVVTLGRELREGGAIDGQIRLYDVESEGDAVEADARRFFERTLLTDGLEDSLKRLRDTLRGEDRVRIHELYGPYGTGKSHQMVALYHCFASPDVVAEWAAGRVDGLGEALPVDAVPVALSLQKEQYEYLWEPLFERLDHEPDEGYDEGGYPAIDVVREAVGDRTVALFVDELEDWFGSLEGRREDANRGFLQALFEASARPDADLFVFVSVLREDSAVHDVLARQPRVDVNMSTQVDVRDVLRHRLVDSVDRSAARAVVDRYVEAYASADCVDVPDGLREEMYDAYPFHPLLVDSLRTRYVAERESGATRGMLSLLADVLVDRHREVDLVTHGDVDAVEYNDELARIDVEHSRPDRCYDDVRERLADADVDHGRAILSTVLLESLTPGLAEGATTSEVVLGTYRAGDRVNDIVVDLERLQGEVYHLWRSDDRYVVREDQNPRSIVASAARDVDDGDAMALVGETVEAVFGRGACAVGFDADGELETVPDDRDVTVVVKSGPWDEDSVAEVVANPPAGRRWRNALAFVQPEAGTTISSGSRSVVERAREVLGAATRADDRTLPEGVREEIERLRGEYEDALRERVERAYGELVDGDDLLGEFERAAELPLEVVVDGDPLDAGAVATAVAADPFDLRRHVPAVVRARLDGRSETSVDEIYEQFLMDPSRPVPGSPSAVVDAVEGALADEPVLAHDGDGFADDLRDLDRETVLVRERDVERWTPEDVAAALRRRFDAGTDEVDLEGFERDLRRRTDVRLRDPEAAVETAAGRLAAEDRYALVDGDELRGTADPSATLRDVSDAATIGPDEVRGRLEEEIADAGEADAGRVLAAIRADPDVYLPDAESGFRAAVRMLLASEHRIEAGGDYAAGLDGRDPTAVVVAPTVPGDVGERIREYVAALDGGAAFDVETVRRECAPDRSEAAVEHFLLAGLGPDDPRYVVDATGSSDPADWSPGDGFRVPSETGWTFEYRGDSPAALRRAWSESRASGSVSRGSLSFTAGGDGAVPGAFEGAEFRRVDVDLRFDPGQSPGAVADVLERVPESATNVDVTVRFE